METKPPLLRTYDEACLLWIAKGWGMGAVVRHLAEDATLDEFNLSQPSISRRILDVEAIPPRVAEAIEGLETRKAYQRRTEIVEEGLRVVHGQTTKREAQELALALLGHFPTSDLALKLADALLAQAQVANGSGSLLDVFAQAIAGRLPHIDTAKLARIVARRIARGPTLSIGRLALVAVVASAVACGTWFLLDKQRSHVEPRSAVLLVASEGPAVAVVSDPREWLAKMVEEMGEKPSVPLNQPVPLKPFPGQKVPPCDLGFGQTEVNAGCWVRVGDVKPPCGRLFRSGDGCYIPVAADPQKPVGSDTHRAPAP